MNTECVLEKNLACISRCEYRYFFNKSNVLGVGVGFKIKNGFCTFKRGITVFVNNKVPLNQLSRVDIIPRFYKGFFTDVIEIDIPKVCSLTKRIRPVVGGYGIGVDGLTTCSMACLVADNYNDYMLTSNHGIAGNSNAYLGKAVVQPSPKYGGKAPRDVVGIVSKYEPVDLTGDENSVDAAIVETDRSKANAAIAFVGPIGKATSSALGESVKKVGAKTELTTGVLKTKYATIKVNFLDKMVTFKDQLFTSKMSSSGDSGSLLLNTNTEVLGLLMADTSTLTIYNPIFPVLEELDVHLLRV